MSWRSVRIFRIFCLVVVCVVAAVSAAAKARAPIEIAIDGMAFVPKTISVPVGQEIRWVNHDLVAHTVTAPGTFDSKTIAPNGTWTFTPKKKGHLGYKCLFHPTMSASLDVR